MKARFQIGLAPYTGKTGEIVYCFSKYMNGVYVRRYAYPSLSENHHKLGSISKNIFGIKPSEEYISDLRDYLLRYNKLRDTRHSPILSWSVLYNKLMRAMAKADPSLDLRTITRDEIYTKNLPCISIKKAVEAGLLPKVLDWQIYTHQI